MYLIWKVFYRGLERCFTNSKKNVRYAFVVILIVCHPIKSASSPPPPVVASTPFSWSAFLFVLCRSMDYCIKKKKNPEKNARKKGEITNSPLSRHPLVGNGSKTNPHAKSTTEIGFITLWQSQTCSVIYFSIYIHARYTHHTVLGILPLRMPFGPTTARYVTVIIASRSDHRFCLFFPLR